MFPPIYDPIEFEKWLIDNAKAGRGKLIIIDHQPYSKSNSRRLVPYKKQNGKIGMRNIKSENAMSFKAIADATKLCYGNDTPPYEGRVVAYCLLAYRSRRSDSDPSLVWDVLQGKAYLNDRQIGPSVVVPTIDKDRPRAVVLVCPLQ